MDEETKDYADHLYEILEFSILSNVKRTLEGEPPEVCEYIRGRLGKLFPQDGVWK